MAGQVGFFSKFPKIDYPYGNKLVPGVENNYVTTIETTNILKRYMLDTSMFKHNVLFQDYKWKDEDRPDTIAFFYYGDSKLHWIVMLSGELFDWAHNLPMKTQELHEYMQRKWAGKTLDGKTFSAYPSTAELGSIIHHYEVDGYIVDRETFNAWAGENKKAVSVFEYEFLENETRRQVKLLDRIYVPRILSDFRTLMREARLTTQATAVSASIDGPQ